jgi:SNF2 family DNA or RNA helicase
VAKVLVIAPKRVAEDTWSRESAKWDHLHDLRISKVLGAPEQRAAALRAEADIYIINRENVKWLTEHCGKWDFDTVVIDELSSFKSSQSQRFKALRKVIVSCTRVIGLTGTPAANGYMDLWSEIYLLDRGKRLGLSITLFRQTYFDNVSRDMHYGIYVLKRHAEGVINSKLSDICLSMNAKDYLDMPERIENEIPIVLSDAEKAKYERMEKEALLELEDGAEIAAFNMGAVMNKLLQLANGFAYDEDKVPHRIHEKKLDALDEIIDVNPGQPVLVFYWFKADLEALRSRFPKARTLDTSEDIADWNDGKIDLLFVHPASAGHGLNLQEGGHIIVWYGVTWSLELYQQANARLYRQGQKADHVVINHLIAAGTIDEQVMRALKRKDVTQAALMKALKERSGNAEI